MLQEKKKKYKESIKKITKTTQKIVKFDILKTEVA